jgi:hypothetical protein
MAKDCICGSGQSLEPSDRDTNMLCLKPISRLYDEIGLGVRTTMQLLASAPIANCHDTVVFAHQKHFEGSLQGSPRVIPVAYDMRRQQP